MEERRRKINALVETLPPIMQPVFGKDVCVLASRVGRELLFEVGVEAQPLPVRVAVINRPMFDRIEGDFDRLFEKWSDEEENVARDEGCWAVMLGWDDQKADARGTRFAGHVVLTTTNPDGIIDLTLDQAARPKLGLPVEPAFMPLDRRSLRALRRGEGAAAYKDLESGARIVYGRADDLEQGLRAAPDWSGRGFNEMVRQRTIAEARTAFRRKIGLAR